VHSDTEDDTRKAAAATDQQEDPMDFHLQSFAVLQYLPQLLVVVLRSFPSILPPDSCYLLLLLLLLILHW
jgi:hypothetical protein